ncbi:hypothetical protein DFH09DRAFT_508316 [Mycena vulgaris]|nr:hypothetical protein DFH09DRAFT_508316 [Mycena vulgaris]
MRTFSQSATVVMSHDDDWRDILLCDDEHEMGNPVNLLQQICDQYVVIEDEGTISLAKKDPETRSTSDRTASGQPAFPTWPGKGMNSPPRLISPPPSPKINDNPDAPMPPRYQVQMEQQQHCEPQAARQGDLLQHPVQRQYDPTLGLISSYQYQALVYPTSPPHGPLAISASLPDMYDPLSPPVFSSDTSSDTVMGGFYLDAKRSGANSPGSSRGNSLVQRQVRHAFTPSPINSSGRRHRARSQDSDDDDDDMTLIASDNVVQNKEATRRERIRQERIETEQRHRDELRDGYIRLKKVLPDSNVKSSKASLLDRATNYISALESKNKALQDRIATTATFPDSFSSTSTNDTLANAPTYPPLDPREAEIIYLRKRVRELEQLTEHTWGKSVKAGPIKEEEHRDSVES